MGRPIDPFMMTGTIRNCHLESYYYIPCFLFAGEADTSGSGKGRFSKEWSETGLSDWKDGINEISRHETSETHLFCCERFNYFKQVAEMLDEQRAKAAKEREIKIKNNRAILRWLTEMLNILAQQNIAFRGHREGPRSLNQGNYLVLLQQQAKYDEVLKHHFSS